MFESFKSALLQCLGGEFPEPCPLNPQTLETSQQEGYRLEKLTYEGEPGDVVPAYLLIPDAATAESSAEAVVCFHQHGGNFDLGKSEPAGLAGDPDQWMGKYLAQRGYVVLCPDALAFEERRRFPSPGNWPAGAAEERWVASKQWLVGRTLAWKNIVDNRQAVNYLVSRPEVNADRIGCFGHSMGGTEVWQIAPWEERFKAMVSNGGVTSYREVLDRGFHHCFTFYINGLLNIGEIGDVIGAAAPRPFMISAGEKDGILPLPGAIDAYERARKYYEAAGAPDNIVLSVEYGLGHALTEPMRERIFTSFEKHLRG